MIDWQWVKIRSSHIVLTPTRAFDTYRTLCGRTAVGETYDEMPSGRSCETCLRAAARMAEAPQP